LRGAEFRFQSRLSDGLAAGNLDALGGDPAVIRAEQAGNHRTDIIRNSNATQSGHAGDVLIELGRIAHRAAQEVGFDRTRRNAVGGDAAASKFLRHIERERFDGALRRRIGREARQSDAGKPRREVDDATAVSEQRQQCLRQEENAFDVSIEQRIELGLRGVGDAPQFALSGVVHEVIEVVAAPSFGQRLADNFSEGL
jgi:hypothetical protein